jgi:hypothetical protein
MYVAQPHGPHNVALRCRCTHSATYQVQELKKQRDELRTELAALGRYVKIVRI